MGAVIAFLRGINVGGKNVVPMAALKESFEAMGFKNVRTLLNSGNVVFEVGGNEKLPSLEKRLEREIAERLKVMAEVMLRSAAELDEVIARNPFPKEAQADPSHLLVMFFKSPPAASAVRSLESAIKGREKISLNSRELYIIYPDGIGTSKFTNVLIEKSLSLRGTARNWNTLLKLAALTPH